MTNKPINLDKADIEFGIGRPNVPDSDEVVPMNLGSDYTRLAVFLRDYERGRNYTVDVPEWVYESVKNVLAHYHTLCVETGERNV